MHADGYAVKTIKDTVLVLRMILRFGERLGAWPHLDFAVHYPGERPSQVETLHLHHQQLLLQYLRTHFSFRNLGLLICLQSGLRIGEICGLQWRDLDMLNGVIRVRKTVPRIYIADEDLREYFVSIDTPKTTASVREIPLSRALKDLIRPLGKVMDPDTFVLSGSPEPMEPRCLRRYFKHLLAELGIPQIRFHALRHTFATRCIEARCDYKTVSAILGHASISTTLDLYVHPGLAEKKKCIDRLAKSLIP